MKSCKTCGQVKSNDGFYKQGKNKDGLFGSCKECVKARVRNHRAQNIERFRAYDRWRGQLPHRINARQEYDKTERGKEAQRRASKAWDKRNPVKKRASTAVSRAIRQNKIQKLPCFVCGTEKVEAHHADYDNHLGVVWLCNQHHAQLHKEFREMIRELEDTAA